MKNNLNNNQKGQALLFTVVAVTISLAIGVTIATRNLGSISRITRSDTAAKAYSAAEGGIERLLALSDSVLNNLAGNDPSKCMDAGFVASTDGDGTCVLNFPAEPQGYNPVATLKVEKFTYTNQANSYYGFRLEPGITKEVALTGYGASSVRFCWDKQNDRRSAVQYYSYNPAGEMRKGGLYPSGFTGAADLSGFAEVSASPATASVPFRYCTNISLVANNPFGLRIKALYAGTDAAVYPNPGGDFPEQGYLLTSIGKIEQEGQVKETRKVKLFRSMLYMPPFFDYAIFDATGNID